MEQLRNRALIELRQLHAVDASCRLASDSTVVMPINLLLFSCNADGTAFIYFYSRRLEFPDTRSYNLDPQHFPLCAATVKSR